MEDKCIIMAFIQSVTDNPLHLCLVILYDVSAEDTLCSSNHHVSTRGGGDRFTESHCGTINRKRIGKKGTRRFEGWFCARVLRVSKVAEKKLFDVRITARWSQQHQPLYTSLYQRRIGHRKWTNFQPVKPPVWLQQCFTIIPRLLRCKRNPDWIL